MFTPIERYIEQSREARRAHLDLDSPCVFIGGHDSREFRGLLAHFLKTTIPSGRKVVLCHACHQHLCSNIFHLYWGTGKDNIEDQKQNGTYKSQHQRVKEKYSDADYRECLARGGRNSKRLPG